VGGVNGMGEGGGFDGEGRAGGLLCGREGSEGGTGGRGEWGWWRPREGGHERCGGGLGWGGGVGVVGVGWCAVNWGRGGG